MLDEWVLSRMNSVSDSDDAFPWEINQLLLPQIEDIWIRIN